MINFKLNGKKMNASEESTILDVARKHGYDIPTMCHLEGHDHFASCLICIVKDQQTGKLIPSCTTRIQNSMDIITGDEEVLEARKTALELLLSDHVGDCEAPCQTNCPAYMDIPLMNRLLAAGKIEEALRVVKKDIALPAVLGRICPAPCERACHRRTVDTPVSICMLKRYAADHDLDLTNQYIPPVVESNGRKIGIIGTGPAGLAAAYFLLQKGYTCVLYDKNPFAGGALKYAIPNEKLPKDVLDKEIDVIRNMGAIFKMETEITRDNLPDLKAEYDAVIIATGEDDVSFTGVEKKSRAFVADRNTHQTADEQVFAIGSAVKPGRVAIRATAHGKQVALSIDQYLNGKEVVGEKRVFNSRFGRLLNDELVDYMLEANEEGPRTETEGSKGFSIEEMKKEASRCMHCDCRKQYNCKLRDYSDEYEASQKRFFPKDRKKIRKIFKHEPIVYEPEKCIKCGICVRITSEHKEKLGLTFIGKGFDVEVAVPFDNETVNALEKTAILCAEKCPTGALALNESNETYLKVSGGVPSACQQAGVTNENKSSVNEK
jgi:NADPH-dependent glutamate synthase beta subunit-like oxidoreductase